MGGFRRRNRAVRSRTRPISRTRLAESPPHPEICALARISGLSPQAGRGEGKSRLFRPHGRVAAGAAGGRDDGGVAGVGGRGVHVGIHAGGRTEHAVGFGELVAERFPGLAGGGAVGRGGAVRAVLRHAVGGVLGRWRRSRLRRRRRERRGLRDRGA